VEKQKPMPQAVQTSFDRCPRCEYDGGFHVLLQMRPPTGEAMRTVGVLLKCPGCQGTYDVGWQTELTLGWRHGG